jgi:hypothetical protein
MFFRREKSVQTGIFRKIFKEVEPVLNLEEREVFKLL